MGLFDRDFREMLASEVVSVAGGLAAGIALALTTDRILLIPGMLILLPGFLEMRGNISGSFASRLSSGMFLGVVKPNRMRTKLVRGNVLASFALALAVSLGLGLLAFTFTFLVIGQAVWALLALPVLAGLIANAIEIPLTLVSTFALFRRGHDPNNVMGPFVTTTGDITSIAALLLASVILL